MRGLIEGAVALFDWIVYEIAGYQTGRLILSGLTFGRIDVEPWNTEPRPAPRQAGGNRTDRLITSAACATFVGLTYWLILTIAVALISIPAV
jgi:hypothetical protein